MDVRPTPEAIVEQALTSLMEARINKEEQYLFKVGPHNILPYMCLSGPEKNVRKIFNLLQEHLMGLKKDTFGEIVEENREPYKNMGWYKEGETPFGIIRPENSILAIRYSDLNRAQLLLLAAIARDYRPEPPKNSPNPQGLKIFR